MGTPEFISPEQAEGQKMIDSRTDVYSVGAVLYKALCGRPPLQGKTPMDTLQRIVNKEPIPPRQIRPGIPKNLETVCLKCLEKSPHRRYATAKDLAADMERFLAGEPIHARPPSFPEKLFRRMKKHGFLLLAGLAILTAVGITAAVVSSKAQEESQQIEAQLGKLRTRVASLTNQEQEKRRSLKEEIEQVLRNGTEKEKAEARKLLRTLGQDPAEGGEAVLESTAARLLEEAQAFITSHPEAFEEALARFRGIALFAPDTPAGRKADQRVRELTASRSNHLSKRFQRTSEKADALLAQRKPGAAVQAWQELVPALSDERRIFDAVSRIQNIVQREHQRYFDAWTRANTLAQQGDLTGAIEAIRPFTRCDLGDISRWAGQGLSKFETRRAEVAKAEEAQAKREEPTPQEEERAEKIVGIVDRLSARIRQYDFEGFRTLREEILTQEKDSALHRGLRSRLTDLQAVEELWGAFRRAMAEHRGKDLEIRLRDAGGLPPTPKKMKILGVEETGLRVRMMNATVPIPFGKIHPLSVAEHGAKSLGGGSRGKFATGVFLYCCGLFPEAESLLAPLIGELPESGWFLDRIRQASIRVLEQEAQDAFKALQDLERAMAWEALKKGVKAFRRRYKDHPFFQRYAKDLSRLEKGCTPILLRALEVLQGACSPAEGGKVSVTYDFTRAEDLQDWVWASSFYSHSIGFMEREEGEIRFQGANYHHLCRFVGDDFSANLRLTVDTASGLWGVKIYNFFIKVRDEGKVNLEFCRDHITHAPFFRMSMEKPEGNTYPLKIHRKDSRLTVHLGEREVYAGPVEGMGMSTQFVVFSRSRTLVRLERIRLTGRPALDRLEEIHAQRQARKQAERVIGSAPLTVMVTPTRIFGWKPRELKAWSHGNGQLSGKAVNRSIDLESKKVYENLHLEAMLRASGRGEASIDARNNTGQEREITVPTGGRGKWFRFKFTVWGGHAWGSINDIPTLVTPSYAPILPGPIELGVEPGSSLHVRALQVRALKKTFRWPSGWVPLFNGKDLSGWVVQGSKNAWEVRDEAIRGRRGEDEITGLQSLEYLTNFELKLEVKPEDGSATRIHFRLMRRGLFISSIPSDGKWHRVHISARGKKIRAMVDGSPVEVGRTTEEDEVPRLGSIRLHVERGVVWFRNVLAMEHR
ncbi:MAG: family 16 glycoside hydrolase [Planctomycetota bacterium]